MKVAYYEDTENYTDVMNKHNKVALNKFNFPPYLMGTSKHYIELNMDNEFEILQIKNSVEQ